MIMMMIYDMRKTIPKFSIMMNSTNEKLSLSCMTQCLSPSSVFNIIIFKLPSISNRSKGTTRELLIHPVFLNPLVRARTNVKLSTINEITHLAYIRFIALRD